MAKWFVYFSALLFVACQAKNRQPQTIEFLGQKNLESIPVYEGDFGPLSEAEFYFDQYENHFQVVSAADYPADSPCQFEEQMNQSEDGKAYTLTKKISGETCPIEHEDNLTRTNELFASQELGPQTESAGDVSGKVEWERSLKRLLKELSPVSPEEKAKDHSLREIVGSSRWTQNGRNNSEQYVFGITSINRLSATTGSGRKLELHLGKFMKRNRQVERGAIKAATQISYSIEKTVDLATEEKLAQKLSEETNSAPKLAPGQSLLPVIEEPVVAAMAKLMNNVPVSTMKRTRIEFLTPSSRNTQQAEPGQTSYFDSNAIADTEAETHSAASSPEGLEVQPFPTPQAVDETSGRDETPGQQELVTILRHSNIKLSFTRDLSTPNSQPEFTAARINGKDLSLEEINSYLPFFHQLFRLAHFRE